MTTDSATYISDLQPGCSRIIVITGKRKKVELMNHIKNKGTLPCDHCGKWSILKNVDNKLLLCCECKKEYEKNKLENEVHEKLKCCAVQTCNGIMYDIDEETIDELVKEYFEKSYDKRKGFNGFFKYIGIEPYGSTVRGSFEYEPQFLMYVYETIVKQQKVSRHINKLKRKYGNNLLDW